MLITALCSSCLQRLLAPGHAIEAGWFLLQFGRKYIKDASASAALRDKALRVVTNSMALGWDKQHGGLFYFLDIVRFCGADVVHVVWFFTWATHSLCVAGRAQLSVPRVGHEALVAPQ